MKTNATRIAITIAALLPVASAIAGDGPFNDMVKAMEKGRERWVKENVDRKRPEVVVTSPRHEPVRHGHDRPHVCRTITQRYWVAGYYTTRQERRWVRDCHGGHYEHFNVRHWVPGRYEVRTLMDPNCSCRRGGHRYTATRHSSRGGRSWSFSYSGSRGRGCR